MGCGRPAKRVGAHGIGNLAQELEVPRKGLSSGYNVHISIRKCIDMDLTMELSRPQ